MLTCLTTTQKRHALTACVTTLALSVFGCDVSVENPLADASVTPPRDGGIPLPGDATTPVPPALSDAGSPAHSDAAVTPPASASSPWCAAKAVLDTRCVSCHDGKGTGGSPFGLASYADVSKPSPTKPGTTIAARVGVRVHPEQASAEGLGVMPPGRPIPANELAAIDAWLAAGAGAGADPSCASAPAPDAGTPAPAAWPPAECDAVYKLTAHGSGGLDTPLSVQASAETHPQVTLDAPWGNEKVQAIAFRPITDNAKVLHHWILYANGGGFLTGWAPGDDERTPFPADVGMEMPTGAGSLRLDMHYFNTNSPTAAADKSGVEVCVVKGAHLRKNSAAVTMSLTSIGGLGGLAPANTANHDAVGTCVVNATQPVHLMAAAPHAHKYAVHMKFTVKRKDGTEVVMHDAPFQFGEQGTYALDPEVIVNTGDVITTTCTYTNNTNKNITFGESTTNEMCFNFAPYWPKGAFSCGGAGAGGLFGGF